MDRMARRRLGVRLELGIELEALAPDLTRQSILGSWRSMAQRTANSWRVFHEVEAVRRLLYRSHMRLAPALLLSLLVVLGACDGGTGPLVDGSTDGMDSMVQCTSPIGDHGPGYLCGTCATDGIRTPVCTNAALTCSIGELVYCPCGAAGLQPLCCDACGRVVGSHECVTSTAQWECPSGTHACNTDGGTCADAATD